MSILERFERELTWDLSCENNGTEKALMDAVRTLDSRGETKTLERLWGLFTGKIHE